MWKYVLVGNGMTTMPIHSDMCLMELVEYIRNESKKIHPKSNDTIFKWGVIEFVNPRVFTLNDFVNNCPALIGIT